MTARRAVGPGFWTTVVLLLGAARKRTRGRLRRQIELRRKRGGGRMTTLARWFGFGALVFFAGLVHVIAASDMATAVATAERAQAELKGRVLVEDWFAGRVENHEADAARAPAARARITQAEDSDIELEASRLERHDDADAIAARLRATVREHPKALLSTQSLWWQPGALPDIVALVILLWWMVMLVCQGEGPELDVQRSRQPMWEWLFSHPAPPGAIFLAEMLTPVAANPTYLAAPLFPGILFGLTYGVPWGVAGAVLVGIPAAVGLACAGKAIEIHVLLRLSPRARGTVLGVMGWLGYMAMLLFLFMASSVESIVGKAVAWLAPWGDLPWPPVRMLVGWSPEAYAPWRGIVLCWLLAALITSLAVAAAVASARRGLVGVSEGGVQSRVARPARFGREPLYRKELLWFRRDRRALVQVVLVPFSLAALQTFNLGGMMPKASTGWTMLCGLAILFGTYFLLTLGPMSLASEGPSLWIAQTWPRGIESLLKAKAKLWTIMASVVVAGVLAYALWLYPREAVGIVAVGLMWWVFARSLAEKTVTLASMPSSAGEPGRVPAGLRWAALLGTFAFAIGVLTRQWSLAATGVVYSVLTAAAMWQNFRHRLPFLADPWSETLPPAPTLLHAMVGIAVMVEAVSILSGAALAMFGRANLAANVALAYGVCAIIAALALGRFLAGRGVRQREIWLWRDAGHGPGRFLDLDGTGKLRAILLVGAGLALGAALGAAAHAYLSLLKLWPDLAPLLNQTQARMDAIPNARAAYFVMAVAFAPPAEEFLFRGLLYRALDREWGGWRAVAGAAAFFAIYHPALSWLPVGALGAMNAVLFKRTGRLVPAVAAHMAYNAVVLTLAT